MYGWRRQKGIIDLFAGIIAEDDHETCYEI